MKPNKLTLGIAVATLALAGLHSAHAMDDMKGGAMAPGTMAAPGMMAPDGAMMNNGMAAPMMAPMLVSGTVQRYYVDRAGYVSAMDVASADGVKMVRFMPSMAQRVTMMFPVNTAVSVYVTSRMMGKMTSYDLAGVGPDMPSPQAMMMPMDIDAIDILKAQPYVMLGAKEKTYTGNLTGYIADPGSGEVLAIVLDKDTLVRIPRENRLIQASTNPDGVTPLFKSALVVVKGYEEAPLYGVVTPFSKRVAATGISVNGQTLGPVGFGKVQTKNKPLLGFNLNFFGGASPDNVAMNTSNEMGYSSYDVPAMMPAMGDGSMMAPGTMGDGSMMAPGTMAPNADNGMMNSPATTGATPTQ